MPNQVPSEIYEVDHYLHLLQNQYNSTLERPIQKFLYKPFVPLPDLQPYSNNYIEIRVHKCYVTRSNRAFKERLFYGQDQYTSDSDIVCVM